MSALERARVAAVCDALDAAYGQPDLGNQHDPIDELIYILLSTMTTEANYQRSFRALKQRYASWEAAHEAPLAELAATIGAGGLAPTKARRIQALLTRVMRDWGALDLDQLATWSTVAMRRYLICLPGIGYKAASCVAAYSFGRSVCPIDTHTYRVAVQLGLLPLGAPRLGRHAHAMLERRLPPDARRAFHINAVAHGRQRCTLDRPCCAGCPVASACVAPDAGRYRRPTRRLAAITLDGDTQRV